MQLSDYLLPNSKNLIFTVIISLIYFVIVTPITYFLLSFVDPGYLSLINSKITLELVLITYLVPTIAFYFASSIALYIVERKLRK